ncbi:MAG: hypothetical protein ACR2PG_13110 [Hyphomicrobiaceae bacterium]
MLNYLDYIDNRAEIIVTGTALQTMPFEVDGFVETDEYWRIVDSIRSRGYRSSPPISVSPGPNGRWVVDSDDAARFMAVKQVARDFFANLLRRKVEKVKFLVRSRPVDGVGDAPRLLWDQDPD